MAQKDNKNEARKLDHDTLKHITTLCAATLVLMAGFLEKLFPNPQWAFLVEIAFVSLLLSIASSVFLMFVTSLEVYNNRDYDDKHPIAIGILHVLSSFGFVVALISFSIFFLKNYT